MRQFRPALVLVVATVAGFLTAVAAASDTAAAAPAPSTPGAFVAMTPSRVLDTRTGVGAPIGPVTPSRALHLTVGGRLGVPADASAVVLTLTVVGSDASGYLSAYPTGRAAPTASVLNWSAGRTTAGSATVTLGTGGQLDLLARAARPVHLVADVAGWFVAGTPVAAGTYVARTPTRLLDTRRSVGGAAARPLASGDVREVQILGGGGIIPRSGVSAVVGTLTAVSTRTPGYLSVWADGARPTVSSVNYGAYQTVANQVTVPVGATGSISLYASGGPVEVVFDATGYIVQGVATGPGTYVPLDPARIYDSRGRTWGRPAANTDFDVLATQSGVPNTNVSAVVANLTVTNTTSAGYLTAWPAGRPRPTASNLNWAARQTVANQATVAIGRFGDLSGRVVGPARADVVVDVFGYYLAIPPTPPTGLTATVTRPGTPGQAVTLRWTASADAVSYDVQRADGTVPPGSPDAGVGLALTDTAPVVDPEVQPGATYSYAVFARDPVPNSSTSAATVTVTIPAIDPTLLRLGPASDIPLPPGVTDETPFLGDIACPAAGDCVGVGDLRGQYGSRTGSFVMRQDAGSWHSVAAPLPAGAVAGAVSSLDAIGCGAAANCVAVGRYSDTAGRQQPWIVRLDGDTVTAIPVDIPDAAPGTGLGFTDVDCPTPDTCLTVVSYVSTTRPGTTLLGLTIDADGARIAPSTVAAGVELGHPIALDCIDTADCVAVGEWGGNDGLSNHHGLLGRWNGTRWAWSDAPRPVGAVAGSLELQDVACSADGTCTATGSARTSSGNGVAVRATRTAAPGRTWSGVVLAGLPRVDYGGYVECRATCLSMYRAADGVTVIAEGGSVGIPVRVPAGVDATNVSTNALACDDGLRCALAGSFTESGTGRTRPLLTAVADGVATSYEVGPGFAADTFFALAADVACSPDGSCAVAGLARDGNDLRGWVQAFSLAAL